jgi:hypothetical protein
MRLHGTIGIHLVAEHKAIVLNYNGQGMGSGNQGSGC